MGRLIATIASATIGVLETLITGGRFGPYVESESPYGKRQNQRRKDFEKLGGRPCKRCGTRIPGNKYYCAPCYVAITQS